MDARMQNDNIIRRFRFSRNETRCWELKYKFMSPLKTYGFHDNLLKQHLNFQNLQELIPFRCREWILNDISLTLKNQCNESSEKETLVLSISKKIHQNMWNFRLQNNISWMEEKERFQCKLFRLINSQWHSSIGLEIYVFDYSSMVDGLAQATSNYLSLQIHSIKFKCKFFIEDWRSIFGGFLVLDLNCFQHPNFRALHKNCISIKLTLTWETFNIWPGI